MKNIIIELLIVIFLGLILCHIYNNYFNKTLEGMTQWQAYGDNNPSEAGQAAYNQSISSGATTEEAEKAKYNATVSAQNQGLSSSFSPGSPEYCAAVQAKIAGALQTLQAQQLQLSMKISGGGEELSKRVAGVETIVTTLYDQVAGLKESLNDLANISCEKSS